MLLFQGLHTQQGHLFGVSGVSLCTSDCHVQNLPQIQVMVSIMDASREPSPSQGWLCLPKEELLHNSWRVQYRKKCLQPFFFPPGKVLWAGLFALGQVELVPGSSFRAALRLPSSYCRPHRVCP